MWIEVRSPRGKKVLVDAPDGSTAREVAVAAAVMMGLEPASSTLALDGRGTLHPIRHEDEVKPIGTFVLVDAGGQV